ncbi:hypothetical protein [uncultured Robinsoniella sp.]|uniref:hypothetical protein n=1 Tax=uncultured Robinsoniella sp. TaxID=904190 RepID=UPI00374F998F
MEEKTNREVLSALEEEKNCLKRQRTYLRFIAAILAVFMSGVILLIAIAAPRINTIISEVETASESLDEISRQLTDADIPSMIDKISRLAENSDQIVSRAAQNMDKIDFDKLNKAITDLQAVISTLARVFG